MKKVLLFTAKWPSVSSDTDGGSIMITHLIEALKDRCVLDGLFLRQQTQEEIPGLNSIEFMDGGFLTYDTYNDKDENKFLIRLNNINYLSEKLRQLVVEYDYVIIIHCLQAMGLEKLPDEQRKKIILFPMFLTSSYKKSGDLVPEEYTHRENLILNLVGKIITPSIAEMKDILQDYGVNRSSIDVIPRAIEGVFYCNEVRMIEKDINLVYIASYKNQKNNMDAFKLIKLLRDRGVMAKLHCIGSVQDKMLFKQCEDYVEKNELTEAVFLYDTLPQTELAELIKQMHINISVSRWETFGRGIFEGIASGLPTVIYEQIECVKDLVGYEGGVLYANDINEMSDLIYNLSIDRDYYAKISNQTIATKEKYSLEVQQRKLLKAILKEE